MAWDIVLFESQRKERFVEEFIKSQNHSTVAKIAHTIDLLEKHGPYLGMPHAKKLTGKIYELRIRGKEEVRIFYAFVKNQIYLLHAFRKKAQKTPTKEIKVALQRLFSLTRT